MSPVIHILGLGPGKGYITVDTLEVLKKSARVFLRTEVHPGVEELKSMGIVYTSFDECYNTHESFEGVYEEIVERLLSYAEEYVEISYAVPGSPMVDEKTVEKLIDRAADMGIELDIRPGMSFIDAMAAELRFDLRNIMLLDATDFEPYSIDTSLGVIISQVYDKFIASEVKIKLSRVYDDNTLVTVISGAGNGDMMRKVEIPLYQLDRIEWIDHLTSVYIRPMGFEDRERHGFEDFKYIMDRLRRDCPWDKKQTHESLRQYLLEETYEVLEAIDLDDDEKLMEELGDLMLQIFFHAKIAEEKGNFDIYDVVDRVSKKMILRHPHVFGDVKVSSSDDVLKNWAKIKKEEKRQKTQTEVMESIPHNLPALMLSCKVQDKAAEVGFDWDDVDGAMEKVYEEMEELREVYKGTDTDRMEEELGDLLFAVVNVARFLNIQPELALKRTADKFISRFCYIEKAAERKNQRLQDMSLDDMNVLWEEAKVNKTGKKNQK
ncbi:nucleoside triphosphate pyrophosphohydrolase [Calorimonas adulescens]|uniref:Nucleoside triphosphate pyrophosphohydrolase n=1 Tax=Calorimonas adulescens TaxID=2606906 RepID=A0A5D8QF28_9THEO|nr:nucleoside triphosphate pyrophosphohydrolase [Calorimonas adulescens]TZE82123.1 nucleoside triphosphate pyrophosphohydrolase [Calorimonas adulescens]